MDSREHKVAGTSHSNEVSCSFPSFSAVGLMPPRMAKLYATIENVFNTIPVIREHSNLKLKTLLSSPYRISHGMLNVMNNLSKCVITNPLRVVTNYNGSRTATEHVFSLIRSIFQLLDSLKFSFTFTGGSRQEACTVTHVNKLANQLQQLAENVANLQETNEAFRSKSQQENLLMELVDMKGYLELLYQQLKNEEQKKIQIEEENYILRQSIGKYSTNEGSSSTSWDVPVKRELDAASDRLSNSYGTKFSARINVTCPESASKNPPASIETSMDEFGLKISYLYDDGSIAWARPPKNGDTILFTFHQPVLLKKFKIGTGHFEYPTNKLTEATVEILLTSSEMEMKNFVVTPDDYLVVGQFNQSGLAEGIIDWHSLGSVQRLRVKLHRDHQEWIIFSELLFEVVPLNGEMTSSEDDFESW
ncbi:hypothetical protein GHT06_016765 [Daphnia sinensis]|uniref:MGAT4 A/B/C C-terminal domain-containing protein n=1 Tax=Daphnia sinensis TaxID=1820382 RepID=A0AAD5KNU9_9CRUS|nr:hypothetical protein GHT06_016765 [Daphnia sinensis]